MTTPFAPALPGSRNGHFLLLPGMSIINRFPTEFMLRSEQYRGYVCHEPKPLRLIPELFTTLGMAGISAGICHQDLNELASIQWRLTVTQRIKTHSGGHRPLADRRGG